MGVGADIILTLRDETGIGRIRVEESQDIGDIRKYGGGWGGGGGGGG